MPDKLRVLFVCTGNACRSQMAEGWARHLRGEALEPYSAGVAPAGLDPWAVRVMAECGVDISRQQSKHVDRFRELPLDFVVTVCDSARQRCPIFQGAGRTIRAPFDDPPSLAAGAHNADEALVHYRRVRDEIRAFVERFPPQDAG